MIGSRLPAALSLDAFEASLIGMPRDEAWELIGGRVHVSPVGRTADHITAIQNVAHAVQHRLRAVPSPSMTFVQSFYLMNRSIESAILPHVMVRRGSLPPGAISCDDPIVLVEVVNHHDFQRGSERWDVCRQLPILQHYVFVDYEAAVVAVHDRAGDAWYERRTIEGLDAALDLPAIGLAIPLAEIYRDVLTA